MENCNIIITRLETSAQPDGINVFIWHLAEELSNRGFKVAVVSAFGADKHTIQELFDVNLSENIDIKVLAPRGDYRKSAFKFVTLWLMKGLKVLSKLSPNLIIMNGSIPIIGLKNCLKVTVNHDLESRYRFQKQYEYMVYRFFDYIVTTTPELKNALIKKYRLQKEKIIIIPVGINTRKYRYKGINERENAILHVGTRRSKNLEVTIRAFEYILNCDPDVTLYITGPQTEYLVHILSKIDIGIRNKIRYLGVLPSNKLKDLYSRVKITIVPSSYKVPVISPTVLESFAMGTPVIGSDKAISKILLINGYNGYRVNINLVNSIATYAIKLLYDKNLWKKLSYNALKHVKYFDIRCVVDEYIKKLLLRKYYEKRIH